MIREESVYEFYTPHIVLLCGGIGTGKTVAVTQLFPDLQRVRCPDMQRYDWFWFYDCDTLFFDNFDPDHFNKVFTQLGISDPLHVAYAKRSHTNRGAVSPQLPSTIVFTSNWHLSSFDYLYARAIGCQEVRVSHNNDGLRGGFYMYTFPSSTVTKLWRP